MSPGAKLTLLLLAGLAGGWWLVEIRPTTPTRTEVGLSREAQSGSPQEPRDPLALPSDDGTASAMLVEGLTGDPAQDVALLQERVLDLRSKNEVLEAQNTQLLQRLEQVESALQEPAPAMKALSEEELQQLVATERGLAFKGPVTLSASDQSDFRAWFRNTLLVGLPEGHLDRRLRAWSALGVIRVPPALPAAAIFGGLEAEQAGGAWEALNRTLHVPEEELVLSTPSAEKRRMEAYALLLQDEHLDTGRLPLFEPNNEDQMLAAWCLRHGDAAMIAMRLWLKRHPDVAEETSPTGFTPGREPVEGSPVFARDWARFPRSMGAYFVESLLDREGLDAVNLAYRKPPGSTAEILQPALYSMPGGFVPEKPTEPETPPAAGKPYWNNVMGQIGTLLTLKQQVTDEVAFAAAEGWRGDRIMVWESEESEVDPLWWETRWATATDAEEFRQAMKTFALAVWPGEPVLQGNASSWTSGSLRITLEWNDRTVIFVKKAAE